MPSASASGSTSVKKAVTSRNDSDDAAWLLRAVEKKKKRAKKEAEEAPAARTAGAKRPRSNNPSADSVASTDRADAAKKSKKKSLAAQSWKKRRQQWSASAKRADAAAVSAEEHARAEQQQEGFELVFQEVFGRHKQHKQQAAASGVATGSRPTASRVLESSDDDDDDQGVKQRSLTHPQLAASAPAPSPPSLSTNDDNAENGGEEDEGEDDAWTFSTSDSALRLDDFDAKDGDEASASSAAGGGVGSAAGRAAFARWKEEDASCAVGNNFVKLHMRKRFKGSSGKAKKLPAYLRVRGERLDDLTGDVSSSCKPKEQQQALAGNGGSGGYLNDGLDFIDECLQALAKVESERAARDQAAVGETKEAAATDRQEEQEPPPPPRCHHALACQQLVVKKKNKNHGRAFFACPLGFDEGRCDFFLWTDNHVQLALRHLFADAGSSTGGGSTGHEYVPLDASRPVEEQQDALLINLQLVFGHARFRPGQEWAIARVLAQKNTLLVLPTGAGKSLCYQLPALFLPGVTLVISPLISLMNDQFERLPPVLKAQAACLVSSSSSSAASSKAKYAEFVRDLLGGRLKLVFLSPERALGSGMQRLLASIKSRLSLVCVDEAHCVSEWSHHFRPSYLRLARVFRHAKCVLAMTATASRRVADDIIAQLARHQQRRCSGSGSEDAAVDGERMVLQLPWQRSNLQLRVRSVASDEERTAQLCRFLASSSSNKSGGGVIVYVHQQRQTEELARVLAEQLPRLKVGYYHAKMDVEHKEKVRVGFLRGKLRVVVATIAFGMGIDKQNVRGVVHFHMPASAENYLQQVGRAGRDGKPARALLFLAPQDARLFRSLAFSNALHAGQLLKLVELVLLAGESSSSSSSLKGSDEHAVTVSGRASGERHWLTLDVAWAERALDMKDATIETFLTLLAQKLPSQRDEGQEQGEEGEGEAAGVSLLPTGAARCRVQLADNQLRALPAASVVRRLLRVIDAGTTRHASVEREVNGYLSTVTACFHVGEMAHALFAAASTTSPVMTDYYRPAFESTADDDNDQAARAQRQLLQLLRQAQLDGQVQRVTLEARAFHVRVQYRPGTSVADKHALAAAIARELFVQHERMEARQLARLARLYAALSAAAVPVDSRHQANAQDDGEEEEEEKAQALEQKLSRYFHDEEDGDGADEEEAADQKLLSQVLEPLTASMVEQIERDARALVTLTQRDVDNAGGEAESTDKEEEDARLPWTSLSVARVFHGLGSPAFPVRQWREHPLWRKYDAVAFEKLARIADRVVREGGDQGDAQPSTVDG